MINMLPKIATIKSVEKENDIVATFTLDCKLPSATPGQFIMVWQPGFEDEKPFSLAGASPLVISVGARGPFSKALLQKLEFIRGPAGIPKGV